MPGRNMAELSSPVSPARTTSISKLARILRPGRTRRAAAQPSSLTIIPASNGDGPTPPSSPSIYSLSSGSDSRQQLSAETSERPDSRPVLSPTASAFSSSVSEGHGDVGRPSQRPADYTPADLVNGRAELGSEPNRKAQRLSANYSWAMKRADGVRPHPIIITDTGDGYMQDDAADLRTTGKWAERGTLRPLSPSEWIGANVLAKKAFIGSTPVSPVESENLSPLVAASSPSTSSPATPRPLSVYANMKPGDLDPPLHTSHSYTLPEHRETTTLLTEHRRRPRSASEPRSFLRSPITLPRHHGTVPSTPTEYILAVPALDSGPRSSASTVTILPPPRRSSLPSPSPMPDDVYFTAAGRPESRMYISPDAAPNYLPPASAAAPTRARHAHTNSEPMLFADASAPMASRHFPQKSEPSGRPFEDSTSRTDNKEGGSTPVARKEDMWSGNWNREDIQDVIRALRSLK
ncbi:hypothetical protein C8R46DRAFT_30146 [Mycena filopes]|nr:hypothetical protein C8R46DRAFT_30146 [Mycena filopes]